MAFRSILRISLAAVLLLAPLDAVASILLSEVAIEGEKTADEFVELYNDSDSDVNLSSWSLRRKSTSDVTTKGSSLKTFSSADTIPAHGYYLWSSSSGLYKDHADVTTGSGLTENNSLALFDKTDTLIDSLTWGSGHALPFSPAVGGNPGKKEGYTRDLGTLIWSKTTVLTPTNAAGATFTPPLSKEEEKSKHQVRINEVFPNPKAKNDTGEFIELYNFGSTDVDLAGWELRDATTTGKYVFPAGKSIKSGGYLVITDQDFSLSLNNSNETLSLFDVEEKLVHRIAYVKTKEDVTLNFSNGVLRGGRKPTPGEANSENADPITKERVPKKGYRGFAIEFRARGKDHDGDKLKFTWDFGDGHKSYKENTSHKYLKSGRYTITLMTDDGIDTTTETFGIKIEKYRAPKVRIVSFVPNPKGKDSDLEWIEIENREEREVNLKDFSIATGTKKKSITNHPIRDDFIISAKSTKRLTREESLFALGNERGHVELRAPDGETTQHLKYKFDKSLSDNTVLKKEKGKALTLVSVPVESINSEIPEATADTLSETEVPISAEEKPLVEPAPEAEGYSDEIVYPKESVESKRLSWTELISYGTPFSLPASVTLKAEAASAPSSSTSAENESTPIGWRGAVNEFLNRLAEKFL